MRASTTSTEQSGLFAHLLPAFTKASGIEVRVVALGTGQALDMGRRGDADIVFVHDQAAEERFVGEGYGLVDQAVIDALVLAARTDAIVLDPVYTGKGMKGLIALARAGHFRDETVVFLHTGGAQGLFGYQGELEDHLG